MFDVDSLVQLVPSRWWPLVVTQWPLLVEMETGDLCNKVMDGTDLSCKRLECCQADVTEHHRMIQNPVMLEEEEENADHEWPR